jgi:hypothetical protein
MIATTGFTYVYVPTLLLDMWAVINANAENPISEPTSARYTIETHACWFHTAG